MVDTGHMEGCNQWVRINEEGGIAIRTQRKKKERKGLPQPVRAHPVGQPNAALGGEVRICCSIRSVDLMHSSKSRRRVRRQLGERGKLAPEGDIKSELTCYDKS